ncbi:hypothetical protein [Thalassoroseus pseudoceratinae]|uniref:hypothetical protein n=1 Tax=Thalassoroseus pseudoceratinae TaxID=2713176 RepID=UPI00141EAFE9|nr:hypothetical protein [Thalassoroseus pseudoceratinae]
MRFRLMILVLIGSARILSADQPATPSMDQQTQIFPLMKVPAKSAADAIRNYLNAKHDLERLTDPTKKPLQFTIQARVETNSLLCTADKATLAEITALIEKLDRIEDRVEIDVVVSRTGPDGKKVVLTRPTVRTLAGREAEIQFGTDKSYMTIQLTPRVFREDPRLLSEDKTGNELPIAVPQNRTRSDRE